MRRSMPFPHKGQVGLSDLSDWSDPSDFCDFPISRLFIREACNLSEKPPSSTKILPCASIFRLNR
jgi:hypothetical protein